MRRLLTALLSIGLLGIVGGTAFAHHSMAPYEFFATTIEGTVQQFRYVNPHCILVVKSKGRVWHLQGEPPAMMARYGFSRGTFRPGDRLKLQVQRRRDGKPGGFWNIRMIIMKNGQPFEGHDCLSSPGRCEQQ